MQIVLYQPDIPQNTGTILRLGACLGLAVHIIEPAGFPVSDYAFRRAGMDYLDQVTIRRHATFTAFAAWRRAQGARLVLMSTKASDDYLDFAFQPDDLVLFGRESAGVPDEVAAEADAALRIMLEPGLRSLNVAMSVAMVAGEAIRQSRGAG